jgi:hypothetical protein
MAGDVTIGPASVLYCHRRGAAMRNHLLLALSVAILALPLAACNEPETVAAEQTIGTAPSVIASEAKQSMPPREEWIASSLTLLAMTTHTRKCLLSFRPWAW